MKRLEIIKRVAWTVINAQDELPGAQVEKNIQDLRLELVRDDSF
jgi:hypothetical protein